MRGMGDTGDLYCQVELPVVLVPHSHPENGSYIYRIHFLGVFVEPTPWPVPPDYGAYH